MNLQGAESALFAGDLERAKSLAVQSFDRAPGEAAVLLGHIALEEGDFQRAEMLGQTALENYVAAGSSILADALGQKGQRAEAERLALDAISANADSGLLRAVLGEQRVRQAKWDLGTQDFIDALSLNEREYVLRHLWRVLRDLTNGHRAGKVPAARAQEFITRLESITPRRDNAFFALAMARAAIEQGAALPERMPQATAHRPPPPTAAPEPLNMEARPARSASMPVGTLPAAPRQATHSLSNVPPLLAIMRRDRELNETLQDGLSKLGLPEWPSNHKVALDNIAEMRPAPLAIDREEFQREHLNVTSGSVASEIVIERALQAVLSPGAIGPLAPHFDAVGLTQLELALWDGVLTKARPISAVYLADIPPADQNVLAIGAFLGACVVYPGVATWSFDKDPAKSTIETARGDLEPFAKARAWVAAKDPDDVALDEFLLEAAATTGAPSRIPTHQDTTVGLQGTPLTMRIADLWANFRPQRTGVSQQDIAQTIRPLVTTDDLIIFAIARHLTPAIRPDARRKETALAYVRRTGEFLMLESRKHFARVAGLYCGELSFKTSARALDLFSMYHQPGAKVFGPDNGATEPDVRKGRSLLRFKATINGAERSYVLVHAPDDYVTWSLLESA